jgi:hypothetical protein
VTEAWGEQQQASSGESDADSRRLPTVERRVPEPGRGRSELGKHSEKCTLDKFRKKFVNAFLYSPVGLLLNFFFLDVVLKLYIFLILGYSTAKSAARWNPVTPKGLDEHGYL